MPRPALTYELQFFKKPGLANIIAGGWQLNSIITLQSGQPFTPFVSTFDPYRNEGASTGPTWWAIRTRTSRRVWRSIERCSVYLLSEHSAIPDAM